MSGNVDLDGLDMDDLLEVKAEVEEKIEELKQMEAEKGIGKIVSSAKFKNLIKSLEPKTEKIKLEVEFEIKSWGELDRYGDELVAINHELIYDSIKTNSKNAEVNNYIENCIEEACETIFELSKVAKKQKDDADSLADLFNHLDGGEAEEIIGKHIKN